MADFTNYLEQKTLEYLFRGVAYTPPTTIYIGLFTTMPTGDDGTGGTELTIGANGYTRLAVTSLSTSFSAWNDTDGVKNANNLDFPQATANWGNILGIGLFDASSGGNMLAFKAYASGKTVNNGDVHRINAGDLKIKSTT